MVIHKWKVGIVSKGQGEKSLKNRKTSKNNKTESEKVGTEKIGMPMRVRKTSFIIVRLNLKYSTLSKLWVYVSTATSHLIIAELNFAFFATLSIVDVGGMAEKIDGWIYCLFLPGACLPNI